MKTFILHSIILLCAFNAFAQSGQINPTSIQIPNVKGISNVPTPTSGMVIYNTQDQNLYLRNKADWVNLNNNNASTATAPSIYYTITPSSAIPAEISSGIHTGETRALSLVNSATLFISTAGGAGAGKVSYDSLVFAKIRGISSILIWKALSTGIHLASVEFKFYDASDVIYYSIKLTDCIVVRIINSAPELPGGFNAFETIALKPADKISWKDYITVPATVGTFSIKTNTWTATY